MGQHTLRIILGTQNLSKSNDFISFTWRLPVDFLYSHNQTSTDCVWL